LIRLPAARRIALKLTTLAFALLFLPLVATAEDVYEYRVLATNKTSTMEKEMNEAATAGFRFEKSMGGDTKFGGSEVVTVMSKKQSSEDAGRYKYKLLAVNRTSTMQKEMQAAGNEGFDYKDQTVFKSTFGGEEVVVILEFDRKRPAKLRFEYTLLATSKTSTMQKELHGAGQAGFEFVGVTVGKTALGGNEVVSVLRKVIPVPE
jgi:hypothetical protein